MDFASIGGRSVFNKLPNTVISNAGGSQPKSKRVITHNVGFNPVGCRQHNNSRISEDVI